MCQPTIYLDEVFMDRKPVERGQGTPLPVLVSWYPVEMGTSANGWTQLFFVFICIQRLHFGLQNDCNTNGKRIKMYQRR